MKTMENKAPLVLCDAVPLKADPLTKKAMTAARFCALAEPKRTLADFLTFRFALREAGVRLLNDDPSFEATLHKAYEAPLLDEEGWKALRKDLHALKKRLTLLLLEEEVRSYAILELRAWVAHGKEWEPLYEKTISEAKGGSLLGVIHKTIIDAYFDDAWDKDPEASFLALVARFLVDESYDLTKKKTLSFEEAFEALGLASALSPIGAKDLLRRLLGPRATGEQYLVFDGLFYAVALARSDRESLDMADLVSLQELYYLSTHPQDNLQYAPSLERWRDFLHSEAMI